MRPRMTAGLLLALVGIASGWTWFKNRVASATPSLEAKAKSPTPAISGTSNLAERIPVVAVSPVDETRARLYRAAAQRNDPVEREAFLQSAVRGIPRALYASLIAALSSPPADPLEKEMVRAILLRWAWEEPTNVAAWAIDHVDNPFRQEALAVAAQRWASVNPGQLLQWSAGLPPADRQWVLLRSGEFLGRTDPALFAVWRQAVQPGRERDQLELAIARDWAKRDPDEIAAALASNHGAEFDEWRRLTIAGLTNRLATMNGPEAASFVAEKIPPGPAQEAAALGAVVAWAQQDPAATRLWIDRFGSEELRARASQVLLGHWLDRDPATAEAFATSLPAGAVSDQAHERVAQHLASSNALEAITWAERIADPARKAETLAFVISEWQRSDPAAVQRLLRQRPELLSGVPGG